jgi:NitT/TauT family transport system substrate-binding protein
MEMTKEKKLTEDDVVAIISAPGFDFTKVPKKTFKFAEFMHHIGALKTKPESWKDLYFAEAHSLAGD